MSSPYAFLGNRPLDQWKVTELKEELKRRKLATKGLKEDLVKRLDEAVRDERESAKSNSDNGPDVSSQAEAPSEQGVKEPSPGTLKDATEAEKNMTDAKGHEPETKLDDDSVSLGKREVEGEPLPESNYVGSEEIQVAPVTAMEPNVVVSENLAPMTTPSGLGGNETQNGDGDSSSELENDNSRLPSDDSKVDLSDSNKQVSQVSESEDSMVPPAGPDLQHEIGSSKAQPEDVSQKFPQGDVKLQSSNSTTQASQVSRDFGFQVKSDPISSESVSITEKIVLEDNVTPDVKLEVDVKHESMKPSSRSALDGAEAHQMDVDESYQKVSVEEAGGNNVEDVSSSRNVFDDSESHKMDVEELHKVSVEEAGGNDTKGADFSSKNNDGDLGSSKKLLDRTANDSTEQDILRGKQMDSKPNTEESKVSSDEKGKSILKEGNHDDVFDDKTMTTVVTTIENKNGPDLGSVKRKFPDQSIGPIDVAKRQRRWNEALKTPESEGNNDVPSSTPKDSYQPTFKRSLSGSSNRLGEEAPKERVVPRPSRPPTNSLRIDRFLRPFTLKAVQELLGKTGNVTSFWMDHIKTHCYVSYSSVEEATETRNAVYNLQWPPNGGRLLVAEFVDPQEVKARTEAPPSPATPLSNTVPTSTPIPPPKQPQPSPRQPVQRQQHLPGPSLPPPPPLSNPPLAREPPLPAREPLAREQQPSLRERLTLPPPPPLREKVETPIVTLDDLFKKTKATPPIYYLPLSNEQIAAKLKAPGKNMKQ